MKNAKPLSLDTETNILIAAEKVFADKGLGGARVKEIADLCQVTPAMINYYFGSKENLYRTVIENFFQRAERQTLSVMTEGIGPEEKLRKVVEAGIDLLGEKEHVARILIREFVDCGRYTDLIVKRHLRDLFVSSANPLIVPKAGVQSQSSGTMHLVFNLLGCMVFFFICGPIVKEIWKKDIFTKKMIEERKEEVIRFAFQGIGEWFMKQTDKQES